MNNTTDKNPAYEKCGWFKIAVLAFICVMYLFGKVALAEEIEGKVVANDGVEITLDDGTTASVSDATEFPVDSDVVIATDDDGDQEAVTNEDTGYQE